MKNRFVSDWIDAFLANQPVRANSLIITVYGDSIAPHGGTVWLGSFIRLVEALGLNARMVRTSVFRLSKEQWLTSRQIGRRSFYSLTSAGQRRFEHAYRRIYFEPQAQWNGTWLLVVMTGSKLPAAQREAIRRELMWEGFGAMAPGILAHPSADQETVMEILQSADAADRVAVMQGAALAGTSLDSLRQMVQECWNLARIADRHQRFVAAFTPVLQALREADSLDPQQCFAVRTLLIHEFRRVQLRDPQLPALLLPDDWPGATARSLCRELYLLTGERAERHLQDVLLTLEGPLPPATPEFHQRFGNPLRQQRH
ncbi:MAG: phenylacetic acid degradation operon negative regulatory protein PaaX [Betaproteobacteria bacterium]|nr:phenylacetic acid degradation operon negative regulatory protein PaaX [Betaproteobacteria bacterium]